MPMFSPEELDQKLTEIVRRLREAFSPVAIYFFGSHAYGTPDGHSDIDLVVVVHDSPLSPYQRDGKAYLALGDIRVPVDVLVYTREEFEQRAALPVSFERTVKRKGRVIYAA